MEQHPQQLGMGFHGAEGLSLTRAPVQSCSQGVTPQQDLEQSSVHPVQSPTGTPQTHPTSPSQLCFAI